MFYRFKSKFATWDRLESFVITNPNIEYSNQHIPGVESYEGNFIKVNNTLENNLVTIYQAPSYISPKSFMKFSPCLQVNPGKEQETIPDIWAVQDHILCSEKFKTVLTQFDDFGHEFVPILILDSDKHIIQTEQQYFTLNIRRFVEVPVTDDICTDLPFIPTTGESKLCYQLQQHSEIMQLLQILPIWRFLPDDPKLARDELAIEIVYFSQTMLDHLKHSGITGIAQYSVPGGQGEESIVAVQGTCL